MAIKKYTTWYTSCDKCKGRFNYTCWDTDLPRKCVCTGNLVLLSGQQLPNEIPDRPYVPRIFTTQESVILRDIEGPNA